MTYISSLGKAKNLACAINSSASKLAYSTTEQYVVGSSIDYTPARNSSFVEYRYQCLASYTPDTNDLIQFTLMYDDTVSLDPATQIDSFTAFGSGFYSSWGGNQNSQAALVNLRFAIPIWSGQRRIALSCRSYNSGLRCTLHWTDQFREDDVDSSQATDNNWKFSPHLIIYSY